jgi:K+-sensing histidine kinase KdpD/DNA-binding winged helix-turn-helix (wHTH) protein
MARLLDEAGFGGHHQIMSDDAPIPLYPRPSTSSRAIGFALGLLLTLAATLTGLLMAPGWDAAAVVLLYLPPVLIAARYAGLLPALAVSVIATLTFNFFFTEPFRTLRINSPSDIVTVAALFMVAVVTSQLASAMRSQAQLAAERAARNATIAGLARRLIPCTDREAVATVVVTDLARLFDCHAVFAVGECPADFLAAQPPAPVLAANDLAALATTLGEGKRAGRGLQLSGQADWQFHPVVGAGKVHAAIGLARTDGRPPIAESQRELLGNLLDQAALALERARLEAEASAAIASKERDRMRAVLLASIGEDVKPRLLAIAKSSRSLRRNPGDKDAAGAIAAEAARLQLYVDNLVDLGPGEDQEPIICGPLAIDLFRHAVTRSGAAVHLTPKEFAVLAELARHAGRVLTHRHLLRAVWGPAHEDHIDYLRVAIRALRQKLEDEPSVPALILNEPAVGYRLALPEEATA